MHAGIVGAGIIGRLLAFELLNMGWQVSIYDQEAIHAKNNCSMTAAGLLTPVTELDTAETIIHTWGASALKNLWPRIISQLPNEIYFRQQGSLVMAFAHDHSELIRLTQTITHKLPQQTVYHSLTATQLQELEPELKNIDSAYYFPDEGQLDNQTLLSTLAEYLISKKIQWFAGTVVDEVTAYQIKVANEIKRYDMVFDCRGLGGKTYFPELRGMRGELIWLHAPDVNLRHPIRVMHPRYKIYVAPRQQQLYIIGATEIESEDNSEISVRSILELLSTAYNLHAGFREARVVKTLTQCRPTLPNSLPSIRYQSGLIAANGLYRHGFLLAPVVCAEIINYLSTSKKNYPQLWQEIK